MKKTNDTYCITFKGKNIIQRWARKYEKGLFNRFYCFRQGLGKI